MFSVRNYRYIILAFFFVAITTQLSHAAVCAITLGQSGALNGANMDNVAGLDLTIRYDSALLSSPTVTKGDLVSKGMLSANTSMPGIIRIVIISTTPFIGSGQIAAINFASNPGNGGIQSISATVIDINGTHLPVMVSVISNTVPSSPITTDIITTRPTTTPGIPFSETVPTVPTVNTGRTNSVTTQSNTSLVIVEPHNTEESKTHNQNDISRQQLPQESVVTPETVSEAKQPLRKEIGEVRQQIVFKGVVDRFKTYRGDKSLPIMSALFSKDISKFIHQNPAIALSDGNSTITISVDISNINQNSPNFALENATVLSVKKEGKSGRWTVVAKPEFNTWTATLSIIAGGESFEYPLTVAPRLDSSIITDQAGWNNFQSGKRSQQELLYDFNKDGIRNYIDEYIFVANHLARK